ncbi:ABC transporter ATP-binding protein [Sedimentibacter sp. zth1]|uniref:ABC transporter ATP-binding protein n=1 Tax=Sedimentibacter sp. zth1 TaxID=2816908 RepID=UPI001A93431F|nr:ABC transporter ATP-binding protein [Sedimentibacter sp. zth1]QSX06773.1 ABC transporter ATP-binding protein [Sedimentibacter sp. zth1]
MKNNHSKSVSKIITGFLKTHIFITISLVIIIIGVVIISLVPPQILKIIIDNYLLVGKTKGLATIGLIYFLTLLIIGLLDFAKECLLTISGQGIVNNIRKVMMEKKNVLRAEYFSINTTGSIVSRFTNDVETIGSLFTNGIISMIIDVFKLIGIVASICIFSYELALMVLVIIPIIYFITRLFQKRMLGAQLDNRKLIAKVNNHIPESVQNIEMIKSFCKEDYFEEKYAQYIVDSYKSKEKINFYDSVFSPIILVIRAIVIALMVILSSDSLSLLGISIGMVAAAIDLISNIFGPIENLGKEFQSIQQAIAGIKRVNEFLNEEEIVAKKEEFEIETIKSKAIEFNHVTFKYIGSNDVLKDVSFEIDKNQSVTFTGRTGAGKSTLFKLLMGLLEPSGGTIKIGEVNINDIPNSYKRHIFGYVEQSFHFINGTIKEQINLKDDSISFEQIINVMKFVGLHDYVLNLEHGYDTVAQKNMFSQGQCQLLSIARAMVCDPPIMLLDEMTANLDSDTERYIIKVLKKAGKNRTLLSISHRLSEVLQSDKIISLENGKIV